MMALTVDREDPRYFLMRAIVVLYDSFPLSDYLLKHQIEMFKSFADSCMRHVKRFTVDAEVCKLLNQDDFLKHLLSDAERNLGMSLPPSQGATYEQLGISKYILPPKLDAVKNEHVKISLQKTVAGVVDFLKPVFGKSIAVNVGSLCEEAFILGKESQIQQILLSLIHNAEQAIVGNVGEITICIHDVCRHEDDEIIPCSREKGKYVAFSVIDNGKGMDAETFARIIKPTSPNEEAKSSHLGLFFVKSFVKLHKGCLTVKTEEGKGSVFTVYLPKCLS